MLNEMQPPFSQTDPECMQIPLHLGHWEQIWLLDQLQPTASFLLPQSIVPIVCRRFCVNETL